jgi:hypothetical protein
LEPKAHFEDPEMLEIHLGFFGTTTRKTSVSERIQELKDYLKSRPYEFCREFKIDLVIPENALAIPINIPLGLAITELIAETGMPCIAHHHNFSWERKRFLISAVRDYLQLSFPPNLYSMRHVVINSAASRQLSYRTGISNAVIPNVFDFANSPPLTPNGILLRQELGFEDDDLFVLQPTRIVPRKWIERAVELVNLYLMADLLLMTSKDEDFGLPLLEAGMIKLPIACSDIGPFRELGEGVCFLGLDEPPLAIAGRIVEYLGRTETHKMFRKVMRQYVWDVVCRTDALPFLCEITSQKANNRRK